MTADDRGSGRIYTRTYEVSLPTGTAIATIPHRYRGHHKQEFWSFEDHDLRRKPDHHR